MSYLTYNPLLNLLTRTNYMKKLTILFTLFCFTIFAYSQPVYDFLKAADDYYKNGDYFSAAQYYEKYLGIGKNKIKGNKMNNLKKVSLSALAGSLVATSLHNFSKGIFPWINFWAVFTTLFNEIRYFSLKSALEG